MMSMEVAAGSDAFVNSIGINIKSTGQGGVYTNRTLMTQDLNTIGIRNLRYSSIVPGFNGTLALNLTALHESTAAYQTDINNDLAYFKSHYSASNIVGIEAPNEMDYNDSTYYTSDVPTIDQIAYTAIRSDPWFNGIPYIGPSISSLFKYQSLGDQSQVVDTTNEHNYGSGNQVPSAVLQNVTAMATGYEADGAPVFVTETGYSTDTADGGVDETVQGRYFPRLFLESFSQGAVKTFSHELGDSNEGNPWADQLGIIRNDGPTYSFKPAATALQNLITLLSDRNGGQTYLAGGLDYSMSGGAADVHHVLLQKADGTFELALWREIRSTDTLSANSNVTLSFNTPVGTSIKQFTPNTGTTGTTLPLSGGSVTVGVNDQVTVLQISPVSRPAAPAPASNVTVSSDGSSKFAQVSWTNNAVNADGFVIQRLNADGNWYTVGTTTTATTFVDKGLIPGRAYSYRVETVNRGGGTVSPTVSYTAPLGSVLVDPLNDFSHTSSHSNFNIVAETTSSTGTQWANDTSVAQNTLNTLSTLVYHEAGVSSFQATAYLWQANSSNLLTASVSSDGVQWSSVPLNFNRGTFEGPQQFDALTITPRAALPSDSNYVRLEMDGSASEQAIGQVKLWYGTNSAAHRWNFDDATGSATAADSGSPGGATGMLVGGPTFSSTNTHSGGDINLNGSNQAVDTGTWDTGNQFTLSAWVNISSSASGPQTIAANRTAAGNGFLFYVNSSGTSDHALRLGTHDASGAFVTATTGSNAVPMDVWTHVAVVVDRTAGAARLYVNGVDLTHASSIQSDFTTSADLRLGTTVDSQDDLKGALDDVRYYSRTLAAPEISALAGSTVGTSLYSDDFTNDTVGGGAAGWSVPIGQFAVVSANGSNQYANVGTGISLATAGSSAWTDYAVQASVNFSSLSGGVDLLGRVQDANHYYMLTLQKNSSGVESWFIEKDNGGSFTILNSGAFNYSVNTNYTLKLDFVGSVITGSISSNNGNTFSQLGIADDAAYASGSIGLRAWGTTVDFDALKVVADG
jgi:hypothetical protein